VKICGSGHSSKKCVMRWSVFWPCLCGLMSSESYAEVTAHSAKTARAAEDKLGALGRCLALRYMPMGVSPVWSGRDGRDARAPWSCARLFTKKWVALKTRSLLPETGKHHGFCIVTAYTNPPRLMDFSDI
jgi:hypothetical protein